MPTRIVFALLLGIIELTAGARAQEDEGTAENADRNSFRPALGEPQKAVDEIEEDHGGQHVR